MIAAEKLADALTSRFNGSPASAAVIRPRKTIARNMPAIISDFVGSSKSVPRFALTLHQPLIGRSPPVLLFQVLTHAASGLSNFQEVARA